jgi:ABC-type transport system substrate-binding protein
VILRHALPNAILPVIAMIGIDIGIFMGGIVVVESVFGWPGIGQLAWQAIQRVDIPIIMGVTLVSACAIVLGNLLADLIAPSSTPESNFANPSSNPTGETDMKKLLASTAVMLALGLPAWRRTTRPDPAAKPGGSITVTYKDDVATLDPAIGYDWQNWSMIKSLFDGLMDYVPGTTTCARSGGKLRDLARRPGLYLQAAPGVKFHNGREMTAEDVKYSLDRVTNPATQSPGAGFFGAIAGFDAAGDRRAFRASRLSIPSTVKITLSRPDATFLHVMALNFASVVPKEAVDEAGAISARSRSAPGPSSWRNGRWASAWCSRRTPTTGAGVPFLDSVVFEVGQEPVVALLRLQNGEVDVPGDGIPPAKFRR